MREQLYCNEVGSYPATAATTVKRLPDRAHYDRATVHAILDEALVCHVGFVHDGRPVVIPTTFVRVDETLYVHGSPASRMLRALSGDLDVCVTVTLLDGLVLARSTVHHSMNYRSVVVIGRARRVDDLAARDAALRALVEHVVPGRTAQARAATEKELRGTLVLAVDLEHVSAKVRTGGPLDDEADLSLPVWAGEIPLHVLRGAPVPHAPLAHDRTP
ncbi:MAG TPA: pyridoxamine 5'-phosphate oxidase family protein [Acidimicrobiia bacterium]|nr:pyridoxamine 5'-phosphate oxidase family protein [Acidimicrobiia bacterium]